MKHFILGIYFFIWDQLILRFSVYLFPVSLLLALGPTLNCSLQVYRIMLQFLCYKINNRVGGGNCIMHYIFKKSCLGWLVSSVG